MPTPRFEPRLKFADGVDKLAPWVALIQLFEDRGDRGIGCGVTMFDLAQIVRIMNGREPKRLERGCETEGPGLAVTNPEYLPRSQSSDRCLRHPFAAAKWRETLTRCSPVCPRLFIIGGPVPRIGQP